MSSFDSTDEKLALPVELNGAGIRQENRPPDADRHISITLAHELNNILTVVQGHADHLFVKHQENAALAPALKKISDAARRAAELVRNAPKLDFNPPVT
jgi:signal transduction histidine kinase